MRGREIVRSRIVTAGVKKHKLEGRNPSRKIAENLGLFGGQARLLVKTPCRRVHRKSLPFGCST